jgi:hypothetical protein
VLPVKYEQHSLNVLNKRENDLICFLLWFHCTRVYTVFVEICHHIFTSIVTTSVETCCNICSTCDQNKKSTHQRSR